MGLLVLLRNLSKFFDKTLRLDNLEDDIPDPEETDEDEEAALEGVRWFLNLDLVKSVTNNDECECLLKEINSEIYQSLAASPSKRDNWDYLCEHISNANYLAFMYCIINLVAFDFRKYIRLSLLTGQCYVLSITIPGAKRCGIFDERIFNKIVKLLESIEKLHELKFDRVETVQIQVNIINLLEYFQTVLKYVSLEECAMLKENIFITTKNVILFYMKNGYYSIYDYDFTKMSYEIMYSMCNPMHGDVTQTIFQLFSITSVLHNYNVPQSKTAVQKNGVHGENIVDFYVYLIDAFSTHTCKVLTNFIKAMITNPDENMRPEQYSVLLDVCVRYDAAMFTKCNESIVQFLEEAALSDESQHRINVSDLAGRMLLVDSRVNWSLFADEVSKAPREINLLRILFQKVVDVHNTVKLKALGAIQKAFLSGNKLTKQLLTMLFDSSTSDHSPGDGSEGVEEFAKEDVVVQLPNSMYHLMKNSTAHVRKAAVSMLEVLAKLDKRIVQKKQFLVEICALSEDPNAIVKKQIVTMVNNLLVYYPDNEILIQTWTKCILRLMKDGDAKIVEATMESLKHVIFDNIERFENSNSNSAYLPWTILKEMLQQEYRGMLRSVVDSCINNNLLSKKTLSIIESHTTTKYSTEAWLLLSLVANKMNSENPDMVASTFIKTVQEDMSNALINLHFMLEIIFAWMKDFSRTTINNLYETIYDLLNKGVATSSLVNPLYEVCSALKKCANPKATDSSWVEDLNKNSWSYIFEKRDIFYKSEFLDKQYISYMYLYSETCADLPNPMEVQLKKFYLKYLANVAEKVVLDSPDDKKVAEKICSLVVVMTRIAIRDNDVATEVIPMFGQILSTTRHKNTSNNLIVCLTDLCKKHTTLAEPTMQEVISKLAADFNVIRYKALSCLTVLVMQDYLKMRGRLLMNILACIVDPCSSIRESAALMVLKYVEEKNRLLLQTSLLETVFALNGYMQFEGFDLFDDMRDKISPLQGKKKFKLRKPIYVFFVHNITEDQLILFFGHLLSLNEKLQKDTFIKNTEGINAIQDLLYVSKKICRMKNWSKVKSTGTAVADSENVAEEIEKMQKEAQPSTSGGRGKKKIPPINRGIPVLEQTIAILPAFNKQIEKLDKNLVPFFNDFLNVLCKKFSSFVQFVQPASFWDKFREKGSRSKAKQGDECSDDEDDSGDEGPSLLNNNLSDEDFDDI